MRQILVQVARGSGERAMKIAQSCGGVNLVRLEASGSDGPVDFVVAHVPNDAVGQFAGELGELPDLRFTFLPQGVMPLQPPEKRASKQVTDVTARSSVEVLLAGLQSVGSWKGYLGYAVAAGLIVWTGMFTNTVFLLVAAMLIAPFAGPAMNTTIATARGDLNLLRRSIFRYVVALAVTVVVAGVLSVALQQQTATSLMVSQSQISSVSVILPLAAGAAGALNLIQSERSSLVSGTAVGMLVAASLAPPAGLIGMATAIGEWEMVRSGAFLLALQLAGINVAGSVVFRLYGLTPEGPRFARGNSPVFPIVLGVSVAILGGLLFWQFVSAPSLQRSSRAQRADTEVRQAVKDSGIAQLVDTNVRFTSANISGQNTLLAVVYVQRTEGTSATDSEIRTRLTRMVQERLNEGSFHVLPLVDVNVLQPPP